MLAAIRAQHNVAAYGSLQLCQVGFIRTQEKPSFPPAFVAVTVLPFICLCICPFSSATRAESLGELAWGGRGGKGDGGWGG